GLVKFESANTDRRGAAIKVCRRARKDKCSIPYFVETSRACNRPAKIQFARRGQGLNARVRSEKHWPGPGIIVEVPINTTDPVNTQTIEGKGFSPDTNIPTQSQRCAVADCCARVRGTQRPAMLN